MMTTLARRFEVEDLARWLEDILQDARYAFHGIARSKAFFALILFVLAVGIGVNTAIFSIVDAKIIRPLPFHHPSELVVVWDTYLPQFSKLGISPAELQAWQSQRSLFQATAWYRYVSQDVSLAVPGSEPIAVGNNNSSAPISAMERAVSGNH